jgi:tetratricopeptide (TPR) repeat protein
MRCCTSIRAVVVNPRYAPALSGRAEALLALGEEKEALQSLDAALQADPSLTVLRTRIDELRFRGQQQEIENARRLAQAGQLDDARGAYIGALETSPDSPFLHRELADVERRAGRLDAALDHASRAAALEPDEPRTHVLLGEIYEAQGDVAKAAEEFSAALALQPDEALEEPGRQAERPRGVRGDAARVPHHRVVAGPYPESAGGALRRAARALAVQRPERPTRSSSRTRAATGPRPTS